MKLADIFFQMKNDLQYLENELEKAITTKDPLLHDASNHLLKAGGKRIRPIFVLLSGKFGDYDRTKLKYIAVALELIHMASLVHDDVIDDAEKRRGKQTVKAMWDNKIAMYTGDYIFAEALLMATTLENPKVHQILSKAIMEMTIGEINQIRDFNHWDQSLRDYLRRIKRKTALLIAISCQLGAIVAGAPQSVVTALYRYGYYVGMAFQITDDILDFVGDEKKLGKPAGSDLRQGNITLPALYCYHATPLGTTIREMMEPVQTTDKDQLIISEAKMSEAIERIANSEGIEFAQQLADRYILKAKACLASLSDGSAKESLDEIANFIGKRET
ncbi:heptaprenyl diphosphate synthase component II [Ammoniphilus oxalaticus]|uniref:Heptaprenyl diphosphate synthase component 2 n=1 Tax=Ammoniphilus oxalaticus TaxID=66863 RepID=A0A419SN72_9BACL|nr:heptaprenyl diphosphate synthase component II [Ammoniphilus oxalaticus]RKD25703.1 heptaprenyl diphosphate synthase component II [Ammoniphilus oxalaticus]